MEKSPTQEKLEAQRWMDIHDIVAQTLNQHRCQKYMVMLAAVDLGISDVTVHRWCDQVGIGISEYRRPAEASEPTSEAAKRWTGRIKLPASTARTNVASVTRCRATGRSGYLLLMLLSR